MIQIMVYDAMACAARAYAFNSGMVSSAVCTPFMEFEYERTGVVCLLSLVGYVAMLVAAILVTSLLCDSVASMSWTETIVRGGVAVGVLAAVVQWSTSSGLGTVVFFGVTVSQLLAVLFAGVCSSAIYLLEADVVGMEWIRFLRYPVTAPIWLLSMVLSEYFMHVPRLTIIFKLIVVSLMACFRAIH